jgi:hypothetical protein
MICFELDIFSYLVLKIILYRSCRCVPVEKIKVLAQNHRNDVLFNSVALVSGLIGKFYNRIFVRNFL